MVDKEKALLLFSGGFDSVVLLHDLIHQGYEVELLYFNYGQKQNDLEQIHASYWARKFGLHFQYVKLPKLNWSNSGMLEGNERELTIENDYLEMRNLIFLSYAASMSEARKNYNIFAAYIGPTYFKDTDHIFSKGFDLLVTTTLGTEFHAPYINFSKEEMTDYAVKTFPIDLKEVFEHSITCNFPVIDHFKEEFVLTPCRRCSGCRDIEKLKDKFLK